MSDIPRAKIFLSYARADLDAARELRTQIEGELGEGTVWHDVRNLAGDHWWTEIEDAIRGQAAVEHVVLLASAEALSREVIRREWRLAWREGKMLTNVFWSARPGFTPPPLGEQQDFVKAKSMLDLSLPDRWQALIKRLKESGQGPRRPFMAPTMPEGFVARPEEFAKLKAALLDGKGNAVAITAALRGAGGFGKTVLAQALAHDDDIQDAFHDGILWVTLGERPSLVEKLADLLKTLTGEPQGFVEVSAAASKLREVLAERKCLLVIDDVWSESHLRPLTDGAPLTARLVTTRRDDILSKGSVRVPVDAMKEAEAVELLSQGFGATGPAEKSALRTLATDRLGEWPVIIRLVNGFLRKEVERGATSSDAIQQANDRLDRKKLTVFDRNDEKARESAVESTIRASVDYLVEEIGRGQDPKVYNGQRYDELAVFPEDVDVPIATIARLWGRVAEVDEIDARDLLKHLYSLALLQALDLKRGTVRLHDVMRKYLTHKQVGAALKGLHHQFVAAYDAASGPELNDDEERRYFYTWFPTHLHEAGERMVLDDLLLDPQWMQRKLDALDGPLPLIDDFEKLILDRRSLQGLIGRTLRLTSGILTRDRRQLMQQLHGRLLGGNCSAAPRFLTHVRRLVTAPNILTQRPSLTSPGAEIVRLDGFCYECHHLAALPFGKLAVASDDEHGSIWVWDIMSNSEITRLEGHTRKITALAALPDGRLASGSEDETIRLWDIKSGAESSRLEGHTGYVDALAILQVDRLASCSHHDKTIRLWDTKTGNEVARLQGPSAWGGALTVLPDGRLAFGSYDNTIRLWELEAGVEVAQLQGHTDWVTALTVLPDGRLASGSRDSSIRLWDTATCAETARLLGHTDGIFALARLPEGQLASGSHDNSIRLWDPNAGAQIGRLVGHTKRVTALAVLPDGQLASSSFDKTMRCWHIGTALGPQDILSHTGAVNALCILSDGRLASGSADKTIQLWDTDTGRATDIIKGHTTEINALVALSNGCLASGAGRSKLDTIRTWDVVSASKKDEFPGDTWGVYSLLELPDGHLAAGTSNNRTLVLDMSNGRIVRQLAGCGDQISSFAVLPNGLLAQASAKPYWPTSIYIYDWQSGEEVGQLVGHTLGVNSLCVLSNMEMASGSSDTTIRIWGTSMHTELAVLEGHSGSVNALISFDANQIISCSDDSTIRLWDVALRQEIARLEVDSAVRCLAKLPDGRVVAGDAAGRVHWLQIFL